MTNAQSKLNPYEHAVIYVIKSSNCDQVYYGSTIKTLKKRFSTHKCKHSTCSSKKIINAGNAQIYELEAYPCTCLSELEDREAFYILNDWDGCVNENVPGAVRRAGGWPAYMKVYNASPEHRAYLKSKIMCDICGCMSSRRHISTHKKTQKCQKVLHGVQ